MWLCIMCKLKCLCAENVINFVYDDNINLNSLAEEIEDVHRNSETEQSGYVCIDWSMKQSYLCVCDKCGTIDI